MEFSSPSDPRSGTGATLRPAAPRAGLRVAPPSQQPTGVFVVVEMTVLVLVTALAMVATIVSAGEAERVAPTTRPTPRSESRPMPTAEDAMGMRPLRTLDPHRASAVGPAR